MATGLRPFFSPARGAGTSPGRGTIRPIRGLRPLPFPPFALDAGPLRPAGQR